MSQNDVGRVQGAGSSRNRVVCDGLGEDRGSAIEAMASTDLKIETRT